MSAASRAFAVLLACAGLGASLLPARADEFPFGRELLLDARPLKGGKRIPTLEIASDGRGALDLWCKSADLQAVIVGDTITLLLGEPRDQSCTPERARADEELLAVLPEITNWRREKGALVLTGARTLRFRPAGN